MKWWRRLQQFYWDYSSDFGEIVTVFIGLCLAVLVIALFWGAFVGVMQWLKGHQ